jgi:hypothetical protein
MIGDCCNAGLRWKILATGNGKNVSNVRKIWTKTERTMLYIDDFHFQSRMILWQGMVPSILGFKQTGVHVAYSGALGQELFFSSLH